MRDSAWQIDAAQAAMIGDDGQLSVRLGVQSGIGSGIWCPTSVRLDDDVGEEDSQRTVCFAIPSGFADRFICPEGWGWPLVQHPDGLLDAFAKIETESQVRSFAAKWGPLYICSAHSTGVGKYHTWTRLRDFYSNDCRWLPIEPVPIWLHAASHVRAVLRIISLVRQDLPQPVPRDLWWAIDLDESRLTLTMRAIKEGRMNTAILNDATEEEDRQEVVKAHLLAHIGSHLTAELALNRDFHLEISTGVGFYPALWLLLAQAASHQRVIYTCSGCRQLYARSLDLRTPKPGQNNFCDDCRKDYRVAKRISAAKRRKEQRMRGAKTRNQAQGEIAAGGPGAQILELEAGDEDLEIATKMLELEDKI